MAKNSNGKEKEGPTPEEMELARGYALKNLDMEKSNLWNYAAPKLITSADYGKLSEASELLYSQGLSKAPHQELYEQLFLSQLLNRDGTPNGGGAITNPYIQETSQKILLNAVVNLKLSDFSSLGYNLPINKEYKDKYLHQLGEREASTLVASFLNYKKDEIAENILKLRKETNLKGTGKIKGLEKIVAQPKEEGADK